MSSQLDVIAITETSEQVDTLFISNVNLTGYKHFHTPTSSRKGGSALYYVNSNYDVFERVDLKAQNELFETVWIEIKNKFSNNILCASVYRHPKSDLSDFPMLDIISKENKEAYICGDFNIDLLKLDENSSYLTFYNLLCSNGFLPLIHPTRVVDNQSPSLIDNIFTNNISDDISSGNIYFILSEHFSQFATVNHEKIDCKKINIFERFF